MKIALMVVGFVFLFLLFVSFYYGAFQNIEIQRKEVGPFYIVYEDHIGSYSKIGPVMDSVYQSLLKDGISTKKGVGIYYDDPKEVPQEKLRSIGGCIVEEADIPKFDLVKEKYKMQIWNKSDSLTVNFPFKGKLSIVFGVMKVYPALNDRIKQEGFGKAPGIMELYVENKEIIYVYPITK